MAQPNENPAPEQNNNAPQNAQGGAAEQGEQSKFKDVGKSNAKTKLQKVAFYGGDYRIEFGTNPSKKSSKYSRSAGELGIVVKTQAIKNLQPTGVARFKTQIDTEYFASYFDIQRQHFFIQLWDWNGWSLNQFYDLKSLNLLDVATAQDIRFDLVFQRQIQDGTKVDAAKLTFKLILQEIWDFTLNFMDWRTTQLLIPDTKDIFLRIQVSGTNQSAESAKQDGPILQWSGLSPTIRLRCTSFNLRQKLLLIMLKKGATRRTIGYQILPMKALLHNSLVSTNLTVRKGRQDPGEVVSVQGMAVINDKPRYIQGGNHIEVREKDYYLCVLIRSVDVKQALEDRGISQFFVQTGWAGINHNTATRTRQQVNELFYFDIPLDERTKKDRERLDQVLKEKLRAERKILFYLWAVDIVKQQHQNLGNAILDIAQIINYGENTLKKFTDHDTKKMISFNTRALNATLPLRSADPRLQCSITISTWFQKDIPVLDMPFDTVRGKQIPQLIRSRLNKMTNQWMITLQKYLFSFQDIPRNNFDPKKLDQFADEYTLCSFLSKITPPIGANDVSVLKQQKYSYINNPTKLQTLAQAAHFVSCVPFVFDKFSDAWKTPGFLLRLKKGDEFDHSILLASLFIGVNFETQLDWQLGKEKLKKKMKKSKKGQKQLEMIDKFNYFKGPLASSVPLSQRVFVCIGNLKKSDTPHAWVMTIDKSIETIYFWQAKSGKRYELRGRVKAQQRQNLIDFLNGKLPKVKEVKKKKAKFDEAFDTDQNQINEQQEKRSNSQFSQITLDDNEEYNSFQDNIGGINRVGQDIAKIVRLNEVDIRLGQGRGNGFARAKDAKIKEEEFQQKKVNTEKGFDNIQSNFKFLDKQHEDFGEEQKRRDDKHLEPVNKFYSTTGEDIKDVDDLPYKSIDIIFNSSNIWGNMQNRDPSRIYYNIHKPSQWLPVVYLTNQADLLSQKAKLKIAKKKKKKQRNSYLNESQEIEQRRQLFEQQEQQNSEQDYSDIEEDPTNELAKFQRKFKPNYWLKNFTPFHAPASFPPPFSQNKCKSLLDRILRQVKLGLILSQSDPIHSWKPPHGKLSRVLKRYLVLQEHRICERITPTDYQERIKAFYSDLKSLMPVDFQMKSVPMFFTTPDAQFIKLHVVEKLVPRFVSADNLPLKKTVFALTGVLFPYLSQVVSVRLMLAVFYPKDALVKTKQNPVQYKKAKKKVNGQNLNKSMDNAQNIERLSQKPPQAGRRFNSEGPEKRNRGIGDSLPFKKLI